MIEREQMSTKAWGSRGSSPIAVAQQRDRAFLRARVGIQMRECPPGGARNPTGVGGRTVIAGVPARRIHARSNGGERS
jgi:hypothetical protein